MLKIRDQADRKALEKLGLVEPEDEAKALELGFPKHQLGPVGTPFSGSNSEDAMPMVLGDVSQEMTKFMKTNNPGASLNHV